MCHKQKLNMWRCSYQAKGKGCLPEPHESGLARGSVGRDLDRDRVRTLSTAEALTDHGLEDDPGLSVVVGQGPLAVSTAVRGTDRVLGLDGLASLEGGALGVWHGVLLWRRWMEKRG